MQSKILFSITNQKQYIHVDQIALLESGNDVLTILKFN